MRQWFLLWLAQGFGSGRLPFAPGTAGSAVGLLWLFLLLAPGRLSIYLAGLTIGFFLSVILAGKAEAILRQKDPGSIVIDEITALPLSYLAWVLEIYRQESVRPDYLLTSSRGLTLLLIFVAFRLFDVLKPWPIRGLQNLPGGWGITVDDYFAAIYANLLFLLARPFLPAAYL